MLAKLAKGMAEGVRLVLAGLRVLLHLAWAALRPPLMMGLQILAALIVLFEEWGWKPLSDALGWLARFRLIAKFEALIASLPPYPSLLVFALPTAILFPVKIGAMWLLAKGQVVTATATFIAAKIASTALVARLFMLTKPALMRISWFARAYQWFMPWKDALFAQIRASWVWRYGRMIKTRIRLEAKQAWTRWKPRLRVLAQRARQMLRELWLSLFPQRG
jgi:hypothetical protein